MSTQSSMQSRISDVESKVYSLESRVSSLEQRHGMRDAPTKKAFQEGKSRYHANFFRSLKGNSIRQGDELVVRIRGAESVQGTIKDVRGNLLQVDQSHYFDEDRNVETINFTLKHKRFKVFGFNLPKGTYELKVAFHDKEKGDGSVRDVFEIV